MLTTFLLLLLIIVIRNIFSMFVTLGFFFFFIADIIKLYFFYTNRTFRASPFHRTESNPVIGRELAPLTRSLQGACKAARTLRWMALLHGAGLRHYSALQETLLPLLINVVELSASTTKRTKSVVRIPPPKPFTTVRVINSSYCCRKRLVKSY